MKEINTVDAVGKVLCHDVTQIIRGVTKDARFRKGHIIKAEDIPVLLSLGKDHLYVWEKTAGMLHEDEAAEILRQICQGPHMAASAPKEGKIELTAQCAGVLKVAVDRLRDINSLDDIVVATRHNNTPVQVGDKLAGMRVIPLVIENEKVQMARKIGETEPLLRILPYRQGKVGVVTTGNEVYHGRIKDTFTPVLADKLAVYGLTVDDHRLTDDNQDHIRGAIEELLQAGMDMILCTGGMSVDPDDMTPAAIRLTGAHIVTYGVPVLPGAMFLLAYYKEGEKTVPLMGLPGCVMYAHTTVFDLVLPRVLAGEIVTKQELIGLGHGGLCLSCDDCRYPACSFGKGV